MEWQKTVGKTDCIVYTIIYNIMGVVNNIKLYQRKMPAKNLILIIQSILCMNKKSILCMLKYAIITIGLILTIIVSIS